MSETLSCQECGTVLPDGALFCTNCGAKVDTRVEAGAERGAAEAGADASGSSDPTETAAFAGDDVTRVETPGLHDPTQVLPSPTVSAPDAAPPPDPAEVAGAPAPSWAPPAPPSEPWQPPPAPPPGAWQPPPPPQPEWAQEAPARAQAWSAPAVPTAPPSQWQQPTPAQSPVAEAPSKPTAAGSGGLAATVAIAGAILLVIGVFTLWLQSADGSSVSVKLTGWELVTSKDDARPFDTPDPAILLGIAAAALVVGAVMVAGKRRGVMRLLLAAAGIGAAAVIVRDYFSIKDAVKNGFDSGTTIDFQYGFWLAAAGAVVLVLAAVVPSRKQS